ncbi:MAG: hypothetical protein LBU22_04625, partial [Dysgonamonadaceae bacterium]|nr:hypothetical protein [Dysgonamonadaceae bacterium]
QCIYIAFTLHGNYIIIALSPKTVHTEKPDTHVLPRMLTLHFIQVKRKTKSFHCLFREQPDILTV